MHLTEDELVLHYYGEMSEAVEARACEHLERCAACRDNLARLQRVLMALDQVPVPEPDDWFERRTWARLEPSLGSAVPKRSWHLPWGAVAWGAAAALIVIAAFVAGQFAARSSGPMPGADPVQTAAAGESVRERVLLVDLSDHLDRTELALVEFVSGAAAGPVEGRKRLEDLVAANRLYRRTAKLAGDAIVVDVLDELERVLIEIAGASPSATSADLDVVRQRIDTRGLLFKLRVMREQLQERVREQQSDIRQGTTL